MKFSRFPLIIVLSLLSVLQDINAQNEPRLHPKNSHEDSFWQKIWKFFLPHVETRKILYEEETMYFFVTIEEDASGMRHLVFNPSKGSQSIWNPAHPEELVSNSCRYTAIFPALLEKTPQKVLFIGLGGGIMPRFVRKLQPQTQIDIVELDKAIPPIAKKFFGFNQDSSMKIIVRDGREFINRNEDKYDMIFIDAYSANSVPFHLSTKEFFEKTRESLASDGVMTANIANVGIKNFAASEIRTIKEVFPNLIVFPCGNKMTYIVFASQTKTFDAAEIAKRATTFDNKGIIPCKLSDIANTAMSDDEVSELLKDGIVLTDDFAPVELMR